MKWDTLSGFWDKRRQTAYNSDDKVNGARPCNQAGVKDEVQDEPGGVMGMKVGSTCASSTRV